MDPFVILIAGMIIVLAGGAVCWKLNNHQFNKHFPPISDEQFLSRCTPGTDPKIALRVRRMVSDNLGVEYERVYPSTRFVEDLGGW